MDRRFAGGLVSVAVLVVLCAMAGPAAASTAQVVDVVLPPYCKYNPPGAPCLPGSAPALVYQAGPGEPNRVSLTGGREELRISDPAAVISPGAGCSRIDRHSVRCSAEGESGVTRVFVATRGGADTVRSGIADRDAWFWGEVIVSGGRGNDVLIGGPTGEHLYAGSGADVIRGRGGGDLLFEASPRPDWLRSGDPSPFLSDEGSIALADPGRDRDSFDGGSGSDRISYEGRLANVRVDLANPAAVGGARGEQDSVKAMESAVGGTGDDRLVGTDRRSNELDGGEGDDRIVAGGGADFIEGGGGRNVIIAGPGNDQINGTYRPSDFGAERVFCGPGLDSMNWIFPSDFVNDDCERLQFNFLREGGLFGGSVTSLLPLLRRGTRDVLLAPELWCFFGLNPSGCQLTLELVVDGPGTRRGTAPARGTLLGSRSYTFSPDERKRVSLGLSPAGFKTLRRHRALRVRVRVTEGVPHQPGGYLTVLRAP